MRRNITGKERIMASLRGEETDHVSWAPLIVFDILKGNHWAAL